MTVVNMLVGFGSPMLSNVVLCTLADAETASHGFLQQANVHRRPNVPQAVERDGFVQLGFPCEACVEL
jgi:hypothetical protein